LSRVIASDFEIQVSVRFSPKLCSFVRKGIQN